ncbi:MAG: cobalt-precorrin 5A hydrolase [Clostridium sp.]
MLCIISVTKKGDNIAKSLAKEFNGDLVLKSEMESFKLREETKKAFKNYERIVFVSSTGIAVRAINGLMESKDKDPCVIVVDICNTFTISLLSGHLGGGNYLTSKIAKFLNNTPVITTATDNMGKDAPDIVALENNLIIDSLKKAKVFASRLVNEEDVYFYDEKEIIPLPKGYIETKEIKSWTLVITNKNINRSDVLCLIRKNIILGIGCKRNTSSENLKELVLNRLKSLNINPLSVKIISSIDLKKDEEAILNLGKTLNAELKFFTKEEISTHHNKYDGSDFVEKITGVRCVSSPVIDLLNGKIIRDVEKINGMTLTIGIIN